MSKHVDLIAIGALLVVFALAAGVDKLVVVGLDGPRVFRARALDPAAFISFRMPKPPRLPNLPRVSH